MNLTDMFKESSVSNLEWLKEPETFMPSSINMTTLEEVSLQENETITQKVKDRVIEENSGKVVKHAKQLFNNGYEANEIQRMISVKFASENIPKQLHDVLKSYNGLVGKVFIDCSVLATNGFKQLPTTYRRFLRYAVSCTCPHKETTRYKSNLDNGSIDAVLSSKTVTTVSRKMCQKTGLPVLSCMCDFNLNDALVVLAKLVKLNMISLKEKNMCVATAKHPIMAVKQAFNLITSKQITASNHKYSQKVDSNNYQMGKGKVSFDVEKKVKSVQLNNINVAEINAEVAQHKTSVNADIKQGTNMPVAMEALKLNVDADIKQKINLNVDISDVPDELTNISTKEADLIPELDNIVALDDVIIEQADTSIDRVAGVDNNIEKQDNSFIDVDHFSDKHNSASIDTEINFSQKHSDLEISGDVYVDKTWFATDDMNLKLNPSKKQAKLKIDKKVSFDFEL